MEFKNINYTELERTTLPSGIRYYVDPEGNHLPSVTTILSNTGDKSGLQAWVNFVGEQRAEQIRNEAANIGTFMHAHLEAYIKGQPRPIGNNYIRMLSRSMADSIINNGLKNINAVWGIEAPLYYPGIYAGTSDLIAEYNGKPAIMDFKNTRKPKTKEKIGDYFCQLAAYAAAHNKVYGSNIETGVILMADRECNYYEFVIEGDEFKHHTELWWNRVTDYYSNLAEQTN